MLFRSSHGRGKLPVQRSYSGVGRIRVSSGTTDARTYQRVVEAMDEQYNLGNLTVLEQIRDKKVAPLTLLTAVNQGGVNAERNLDVKRPLKESTLQSYGDAASNEILVALDMQESDKQLDAGRQTILKALQSEFGITADKANFNEMSANSIAQKLAQSPAFSAGGVAPDQVQAQATDLANRIVAFRDGAPHNGILSKMDELSGVSGVTPAILTALKIGRAHV